MSARTAPVPYLLSRQQLVSLNSNAAPKVILGLLTVRWLAGILENYGFPAISEAAAIVMLAGLGVLMLLRMRLATASILFVAGVLAWIFTGALSVAANPMSDPTEAAALLTLLLLYGLFANATTTHLQTQSSLTAINRFLRAFIALGAALAVAQVVSGSGFVDAGKDHIQRAFGSDEHPVSFAIQMVAALVALEIVRAKRAAKIRLAHVALLAIGAVALYLTYARTAWVMAMLTIGYVLIMRGSPARRVMALVLLCPISIGLLSQSDRFADLGSLPLFLTNFSVHDVVFDWRYVDNSVSWRIVNWSYGFQQAMEQPFFGFGPGQSATSSHFSLEMHNIFLEMLFEGGVFGVAALLLTLAGLVRMHTRLPKATPSDRYARALANGFGFSLLLAVTFSTSFVDQLMSFLLYMILLTAAAVPALQIGETEPKSLPGSSDHSVNSII